jgi:ABC-type nitrate/sulfonate/bicarbonate transport system substrate-binding protein
MKQRIALATVLIIVLLIGSVWLHSSRSPKADSSLTLALDWTPNTNHTGIYVALNKGWYKADGINLKLLPYSASVTPDTLVASGKAGVGISTTETIVSDAGAGAPVVSIAAIVAHNTSVLAVKKASGITSPAGLEGKTYGGFGAPFESAEIGEVIKHAGGNGGFKNVTLNVDPVAALKSGRVDFVWVFSGWEVIQAQREGLALTTFPLTKYGIPDYATPNIITSAGTAKNKTALLRKFTAATARGYEYARAYPQESAHILLASVPRGTFPDPGLVSASQAYLSLHYQDAHQPWGQQTQASWSGYTQFMLDHRAVFDAAGRPVSKLNTGSLYTNEFLP